MSSGQWERGEETDLTEAAEKSTSVAVTRRTLLAGLLGAGILGAVVAPPVRADDDDDDDGDDDDGEGRTRTRRWRADRNANGYDLFNLASIRMLNAPNTRIADFTGSNLTVDSQGMLNVEQGSGSGLDADTLDGLDSADFAPADHDHAGDDLTPDSITATTVTADTVAATDLSVANVGVAMYRDGAQTIQSGATFQKLQFNATEFDHRGEFDSATNEFVAVADGYYHIDVSVRFVSFGPNAAADFQVQKNGTNVMTKTEHSSTGFGMHLSNSRLIYLEAGDRLAVLLKNWSSGPKNVVGDSGFTYMHVHRVG